MHMANIGDIKPLKPIWPVRPVDPSPRKDGERKPTTGKKPNTKRDEDNDRPKIDEYAQAH